MDVPVPENWDRYFRGLVVTQIIVLLILLTFFVVCCLYGGIAQVAMGSLFFFPFLFLAATSWRAQVLVVKRRAREGSVRIIDRSLSIPVDQPLWDLYVIAVISFIISLVAVVILQLCGYGSDESKWYSTGIICAVGVIIERVLVIGRGSRDVLVLSAHGVVARSLDGKPVHIRWGQVNEIVPCRRTRGSTKVAVGKGPSAMTFDVSHLATGSPTAFWLLEFYARNPSLRDELGDVRVLRRIRDGSLVESTRRHV